MPAHKKILLMMSGSIACAKASGLISEWTRNGYEVRVACTRSAREFVGPALLEGLGGHPVFDDTFGAGHTMDHIRLAQWAELIVVAPATANLINKFAAGIADDAVTTLWQGAWGRGIPQFIVPAMNTRMWNYPATQASVSTLREWGVHVLPTAEGDLACGEQGAGRMLEVSEILATIDALLSFGRSRAGLAVLVTGGGTREPIDAVRYIGNYSTGRTAAQLADAFAEMGMEVTWVGADSAVRPLAPGRKIHFTNFFDLEHELFSEVGARRYDLVVHAAAVSDYSVQAIGNGPAQCGPAAGKLSSGNELSLHLSPNPKLLDRIRSKSLNPDVRVVGFKLTASATEDAVLTAVEKVFKQGGVDRVVHNDMKDVGTRHHHFRVYRKQGESAAEQVGDHASVTELAAELSGLLDRTATRETAT